MKDFKEILKQAGLTVTDDQLATIETEMKANYKPIADYNKQKEKLDASDEKVKTLTASLDKFKDVDPTALTQTIEDLKDQLTQKDEEFAVVARFSLVRPIYFVHHQPIAGFLWA